MLRFLIVLILSGCALAQSQYGADYILLRATTPDGNSNLNFGNLPKPGFSPSASPLGAVSLYFDSTAACIKASINGGAYACLGGGGGSGTVTNTGGALTNNAFVLGAGGNDTKVSTAFTTNGTNQGTFGVAGGGNGALGLTGNTSGTATFTAPAVAGTSTNPVIASNAIQLPVGAAGTPSIPFTGHLTDGFYWDGAGPSIQVGSTDVFTCTSGSCFSRITFTPLTNISMVTGARILISTTAPTIAAGGCGGSAASIPSNNGTAAFTINVGTTPTSACTITLPTAINDWICNASDLTTASTSVFLQKQTGAASTTGATITNFNTAGATTAFVASDVLRVSCFAY